MAERTERVAERPAAAAERVTLEREIWKPIREMRRGAPENERLQELEYACEAGLCAYCLFPVKVPSPRSPTVTFPFIVEASAVPA